MKKLLIALLAISLFAGCGSSTDTTAKVAEETPPAVEAQAEEEAPAEKIETKAEEPIETAENAATDPNMFPAPEGDPVYYTAGMYKVGSDLPAGTYMAIADEGGVIPNVTVKDGAGTDATPISMSMFSTHDILEVKEGEYVDVKESALVDIGYTYDVGYLEDTIPEGTYIVGFHISAGEYKTTPFEGATIPNVTIYSDATKSTPLDMKILEGSGYVEVKNGQVVKLSECDMTFA